jgi:hypothetical protein
MVPAWRHELVRCVCGTVIKVIRNKRAVRHIHVKKWSWWMVGFCAGCFTGTEGALQYRSGGGPVDTRSRLVVSKKRKGCCLRWEFYSELLTCICLTARLFRVTLVTVPHTHRTSSWRHAEAIDRYLYVYHVSLDEFRCFSKRYPSYALRKHMCGNAGCGGLGKQWTKALRCSACYLMCDMYKSSLRHIHDPVLSSLKMKGILFCSHIAALETDIERVIVICDVLVSGWSARAGGPVEQTGKPNGAQGQLHISLLIIRNIWNWNSIWLSVKLD